MRSEFENIRLALEEHLAAINENTAEIQALFDYLQEMDVKLEKVTDRLDQMQLNAGLATPKVRVAPLDQMERKVFLTIYTEESALSYAEIAQKTDISSSCVAECVSSLVQKGVPLHRTCSNGQLFFTLHPQFKEMQAKENVVNLSLRSFME